MGVARLPAEKTKSSPPQDNPEKQAVAEAIFQGRSPAELAKQLAGGDKKRQKQLRNRFRKMLYHDAEVAQRVTGRANAELLLGLGPAVSRLVQRAGRLGKPAEVKLLMEASGFYNPRVQHEHSGDINIKLVIPRPEIPKHVDSEVIEGSAEDLDE